MEHDGSQLSFYRFPNNRLISKLWLEKCKIAPNNANHAECLKVCQEHFLATDFEADRSLKSIAVPCQKLDNPDLLLVDIPQLAPIIRKDVLEKGQLKRRVAELRRDVKDMSTRLAAVNKKVASRRSSTSELMKKISKLTFQNGGKNDYQGGKNLLSQVFSDAQIDVLTGKDKVRWSDDDLAMAFSLRQMSSKECYLYLKETLNIPLPALSCVQKWAASK